MYNTSYNKNYEGYGGNKMQSLLTCITCMANSADPDLMQHTDNVASYQGLRCLL